MMTNQKIPELVDAPRGPSLENNKIPKNALLRIGQGLPSENLSAPLGSVEQEKEIAENAIKELKGNRVDFGDLRLGRDVQRYLMMQDTNLTEHFVVETKGIGIRALVKGFWGFAATDDLSQKGVKECAKKASEMAKGLAEQLPNDLALNMKNWAAEPAHRAEFHSAVGICPFNCPTKMISEPFLSTAEEALRCPDIKRVMAMFVAFGRRRIFASTDGAYILTTLSLVDGMQRIISVANKTSAYRTLILPGIAGGIEHLMAQDFPSQAKKYSEEARAKCFAEKPEPGLYTLIIDGHNLGLTMHESVGHPTELDRVLGYEVSLAGASFVGLDKYQSSFQYGSPIVNFTADNRIRFACASQGFDDEGVECQKFPIIKEGIFAGYGTNRETAHKIGQKRANGTCRADRWSDVPIVRIPNLYLEPGKNRLSFNDLVADTKDGILMMGRDSFSIDQMRYNFQFGADMSYRIRNGKVEEPLRDVIYQAITPEFWRSCDAICDASEWQWHGIFNCGKGHPSQGARMMHGASPSRFRKIKIGY